MVQTKITSPALTQVLRFFAKFSFFGLVHQANRPGDNDADVSRENSPCYRPDCGDYNEAFIVQHWASYNPRY